MSLYMFFHFVYSDISTTETNTLNAKINIPTIL